MQITIDSTTVTAEDLAAIAVLAGVELDGAEAPAKAPAKKAAPARKAPAKKAAAAAPVEEDEEPEEEPEETDGPTLEDAIARAQELVGEKRTDEVKAAVKKLRVERVSKLTGDKIAKFLELVADDEDDSVV